MFLSEDVMYMLRALELARYGSGNVHPNPMVGCVIVHNEIIIGEGYHKQFGQAHAEVNAIESVKNKNLISESTIYVTLEPCTHYGKTPPCVDLLIKYKPKRVIISTIDSNPIVGGKGIEKLKQAGIEVEQGILNEEGRKLNKRFFTFIEKKRPFIILKWAETTDGFIARENNDSKWISHELSRKLVHKWRSEEQAILVGTQTALCDNPQLNVRDWEGNHPLRIVLDKTLRLPTTLHLFDQQYPTICYNQIKNESNSNLEYIQLDYNQSIISQIMNDLYNRKIQSVLVEGGSSTLQSFIDANCWDEIRLFKNQDLFFEKGICAPSFEGEKIDQYQIEHDVISIYQPISII